MSETEAVRAEGERVRPFHCGSQMLDWQASNCEGCRKYDLENASPEACEIDYAIGAAYLGDGTVSPEIAGRMGATDNATAFVWRCPEREAPR